MNRMPRLALSFLFVVITPTASFASESGPERIDPAGIAGSLVLAGLGELTPPILDRFFSLTKGNVVVLIDKAERGDFWKKQAEDRKVSVRFASLDQPQAVAKALASDAKGVWLDCGEEAVRRRFLNSKAAQYCRELLARGGVIGASGNSARRLGHDVDEEKAARILPDAVVRMQGDKGAPASGLVSVVIDRDTALVVERRRMQAIGAGSIAIHLAKSKDREARKITLKGKAFEDLTALRRAARARLASPGTAFSGLAKGIPIVEKGTLVIIGGGGTPAGLMQRFTKLAGGSKAQIVILPTANPDPLPAKSGLEDLFRKLGAAKVTNLPGRTLAQVESVDSLSALRTATGVWFGGGRQWRFVDAYENTKAHELMIDVLKRGGVIGGSSAGATIQGEYLCRGGVFENFTMMYEGYERGLGFLPGVAIDQHFAQRKRFADMSQLMRRHPKLLGIGIDETTAIVVQGHVAEVVGKGNVHFYDAAPTRSKVAPEYESLPAGARYDLKDRRVVK